MAHSEDYVPDNYTHRDSIDDFRSVEILENILDGKAEYVIDDTPYKVVENWDNNRPGIVSIRTFYSYPSGSEVETDSVHAEKPMDDIADALKVSIPETSVFDSATADILPGNNQRVVSEIQKGRDLKPRHVHCVTFEAEPPIGMETVHGDFEHEPHRRSALESVGENSIGTAIIYSGVSDGQEIALVNIDYWHRTFDALSEGGIDFGEIDFEEPDF